MIELETCPRSRRSITLRSPRARRLFQVGAKETRRGAYLTREQSTAEERLAKRPRYDRQFTARCKWWLNEAECWFEPLGEYALKHSRIPS